MRIEMSSPARSGVLLLTALLVCSSPGPVRAAGAPARVPSVATQMPAAGPFVYILPVVSKATGVGGSQWRSDVSLRNPYGQAAQIVVRAFPVWTDRTDEEAVSKEYTLTARASLIIEDLHGELGIVKGNYSITVTSASPVSCAARFFNVQGSAELSQFMNAIPAWEQLEPGDQIHFVLPKRANIGSSQGYRANTFMRFICEEKDIFGNLLPPQVKAAVYSDRGSLQAETMVTVGEEEKALPNGGLAQFSDVVQNHFGFPARPGDTLVYTVMRGSGVIIATGLQNNSGADDGWIDRGIIQRLLQATVSVAPEQPVVGDIAIMSFTGLAPPGFEIVGAAVGLEQLLQCAGNGTNTVGCVTHLELTEPDNYTPTADVTVRDSEGALWSRVVRGQQVEVTAAEPYEVPPDRGNRVVAADVDTFAYYAAFGRYNNTCCFTESAAREVFQSYTDGNLSNGEVQGGWRLDRSGRELRLLDVDGQGTYKVISRLPWDSMRYFTSKLPPE